MGLFKRLGLSGRASTSADDNEPSQPNVGQKKASISMVPLSEVTEASLAVWRQLPGTIRHDPSMVSFAQENERWKGDYYLLCSAYCIMEFS
jgi:hypothetical protein